MNGSLGLRLWKPRFHGSNCFILGLRSGRTAKIPRWYQCEACSCPELPAPFQFPRTGRRTGPVLEERAASYLRAWHHLLWAAPPGPDDLGLWREPPDGPVAGRLECASPDVSGMVISASELWSEEALHIPEEGH